jgi:hypothetical protein
VNRKLNCLTTLWTVQFCSVECYGEMLQNTKDECGRMPPWTDRRYSPGMRKIMPFEFLAEILTGYLLNKSDWIHLFPVLLVKFLYFISYITAGWCAKLDTSSKLNGISCGNCVQSRRQTCCFVKQREWLVTSGTNGSILEGLDGVINDKYTKWFLAAKVSK